MSGRDGCGSIQSILYSRYQLLRARHDLGRLSPLLNLKLASKGSCLNTIVLYSSLERYPFTPHPAVLGMRATLTVEVTSEKSADKIIISTDPRHLTSELLLLIFNVPHVFYRSFQAETTVIP